MKSVEQMDELDKLSIYMHYYINQRAMFHNSAIYDIRETTGLGEPDSTFLGIKFYRLWKDSPIQTFQEFISPSNIVTIDNGDDWQKKGCAQKIRTEYYGIYNWFNKFFK